MKKTFAINALCVPFFVLFVFLSCSKIIDSYYPLNEGITWVYQISPSSILGGKIVVTNLASRELKDKKVTPQKIDTQGQSFFDFIVDDSNGVYRFATQGPGALNPEIAPNQNYYIKYPIKVGTTWENRTSTVLLPDKGDPITLTSTIESIDEVVTVPAGTFEKSLKVKGIGNTRTRRPLVGVIIISVEQYCWYAPGVGIVRLILKEKGKLEENVNITVGEEMTLQLESFKKGK